MCSQWSLVLKAINHAVFIESLVGFGGLLAELFLTPMWCHEKMERDEDWRDEDREEN